MTLKVFRNRSSVSLTQFSSLSCTQWVTSHNIQQMLLNCKYKYNMHHRSLTVQGTKISEANSPVIQLPKSSHQRWELGTSHLFC